MYTFVCFYAVWDKVTLIYLLYPTACILPPVGPMLMITEYCYNGDLLNFLRGRASISAEEGYKNMEGSSRRSLQSLPSNSTLSNR